MDADLVRLLRTTAATVDDLRRRVDELQEVRDVLVAVASMRGAAIEEIAAETDQTEADVRASLERLRDVPLDQILDRAVVLMVRASADARRDA